MDSNRQLPLRAPALIPLFGIIAGLLLSRQYTTSPILLLTLALLLVVTSWRLSAMNSPRSWLITFVAATTLAFWANGSIRLPDQIPDSALNLPPREAQLTLKVERVMQLQGAFGKTTGIAKVLEASQTSRLSHKSRIYFTLSKEDSSALTITRGLQIQTTGVLEPINPDTEKNSFEDYLQGIGVQYRFSRTSETSTVQPPSEFQQLCRKMNLRFQEFLRLGEPNNRDLSRIYIAMLLGLKTELTSEQSDRFRMTGTMHLFAISGLHIGVVAAVIAQTLLLVRLPRKLRPTIGLPLLYLYVEITGGAPSAVRAFLMVSFFWASIVLQRQRSPLAALAASAVFVLIIQPAQLWKMGFQLSYLVVLSILLFGLPLHAALRHKLRPYKYLPEAHWTRSQQLISVLFDKLLLIFAISFSAWLASAPLSAGYFGFIAPYAILINMLLVNLAALVISTGVIALTIASIGLPPLTAFLNHSSWVGISLMDRIVQLNLALPSAIIECQHFPRELSYIGLISYFGILFLPRQYEKYRLTLPPLFVLLTLFTGLALG